MADINEFFNIDQIEKIRSGDLAVDDEFGISVSTSGNYVVVGTLHEEVYIFYKDEGGIDNWGQVKKIVASDPEVGAFFGYSVSISGEYVVVGAYSKDEGIEMNAGVAYIFYKDEGGTENWGQVKKIEGSDTVNFDNFGISVSILGDYVITGAPEDNGSTGAVYIFKQNSDGTWPATETKKIVVAGLASFSRLGISVSISEDCIVAGADWYDGVTLDEGAAYVFYKDKGGVDNWGQVKRIRPNDAEQDARFGHSVSISGDCMIVGANQKNEPPGNNDEGAAYIFYKDEGGIDNWGQVKKIVADPTEVGAWFGFSVSISGDNIVVGVYLENISGFTDAGVVYIFNKDEGGIDKWGQVKKIIASDPETTAQFGISVFILGDYIIVGSNQKNESLGNNNEGAAYIFEQTLDTNTLNSVMIGGSQITVVQVSSNDNFTYTPLVSYISSSQINDLSQQYKKELILNGIPLSLSLVRTVLVSNFSSIVVGDNQGKDRDYCYVLNVIENRGTSQIDYSSPTSPSNKTYTINGNRFSNSFIDNRHYFDVVKNQVALNSIEDYFIFYGIPLAKGDNEEMLMYKTIYTMNDISAVNTYNEDIINPSLTRERDLVNIVIGGVPLTAGRVEDKYYLIVSQI